MPNYTYLIVGGGMTADAAVHGIREVDRGGSIGLLSAEGHPPHDRPPLSKKLWKGKPLEGIWRQTESQGVTLHLGRTARHLDPQNKCVTDDQGTAYGYVKLLLATGGTPRRLPLGGEQIIYFRTLETVADWKEPYREGVVYYLRDGRVRGVLLWNVWEQVDAARQLIAEPGPFRSENLKGRLPARRAFL